MLQSCEQMRMQMRRSKRRECQRKICVLRDVSFTAAIYWPSNITHERRKTYSDVIRQRVLSSYMHLSYSLKQVSITSLTTSFLCAIWHSEQFTGHLNPQGNFYWQNLETKMLVLHILNLNLKLPTLKKYIYINLQWFIKTRRLFMKHKWKRILKHY